MDYISIEEFLRKMTDGELYSGVVRDVDIDDDEVEIFTTYKEGKLKGKTWTVKNGKIIHQGIIE